MQEIQQLLQDQQLFNDPFWQSIFQSDIRNIVPKYQLSKIAAVKNKHVKNRFIMDNIEQFMALQLSKKQLAGSSRLIQSQNLQQQLDNIIESSRKSSIHKHNFDILNKKQELQKLCQQLNKPEISPKLKQELSKIQQWKQFIQKNTATIPKFNKSLLRKAKRQIAKTISLEDNCGELISGTQGNIIANRIKENQIRKAITEFWKTGQEIEIEQIWKNQFLQRKKEFQ